MQQEGQMDMVTTFNEKLNEVTKMLTKQDLKELKEAIEVKDPNLIKMKYQIAEKNIKEAEKNFQKK